MTSFETDAMIFIALDDSPSTQYRIDWIYNLPRFSNTALLISDPIIFTIEDLKNDNLSAFVGFPGKNNWDNPVDVLYNGYFPLTDNSVVVIVMNGVLRQERKMISDLLQICERYGFKMYFEDVLRQQYRASLNYRDGGVL